LRQKATFPLSGFQLKDIKSKMLDWASQFSILVFLDSNGYEDRYGRYECLLAADPVDSLRSLEAVQEHHDTNKDWLFGHICYDYKNHLEPKLKSDKPAHLHFPDLQFFRPAIVCGINKSGTELFIETTGIDPRRIWKEILHTGPLAAAPLSSFSFTRRTAKEDYLETIGRLRKHIADGDCYEINYCTEGYCTDLLINPLSVFKKLNDIAPAPFAAFYRLENKYMMCSSPERYLKKEGSKLISQPIKGTAGRGVNAAEDLKIKQALGESIKERAENVMITDLTRNDLARVCRVGSVMVEELFGVYSYPRVHQMISTISGEMKGDIPFTDALRYSFPMGSMTGAPKIKVMELIEQYEQARRELFSGTVGYITPGGEFDFNVIIRSLFYNAEQQYLSYQSGGAITYDSNAEQEWDEMRLKAAAMEQLFI
jgi:para-aminobenzoate synthetase component 1